MYPRVTGSNHDAEGDKETRGQGDKEGDKGTRKGMGNNC